MANLITVTNSQVIDTLDGTERCYLFPMGYRNFNIQNLGDSTIYASFDPDISSRSYGIIAILPGNTVNIENRYIEGNKLLYVSGTGRMQISGLNYSEMMHSNSGGSGLPGGGGEDNVIESVKVNGTALSVSADKSVDIPVPTKVSELSNDSGYINGVPDDYATKTYVGEQIVNANHLSRDIVETLPTDDVAEENVIYLIKVDDASGNDKYREYMKIDGHLQLVGDTSVDLTGYAKLTDIPTSLPANGGNADTVNNHTVGTDIPADAKFTDTIYMLPTATDSVLGGVKSGGDISVSSAGVVTVNSVNGKTVAVNVPVDAKFTDTVYTLPVATAETIGGVKPDDVTVSVGADGVLSAQKSIDSIEIGGTNLSPDFYNYWKDNSIPNELSYTITKNEDFSAISKYNVAITAKETSAVDTYPGLFVNSNLWLPIMYQNMGKEITWSCSIKASVDNFPVIIGFSQISEYRGVASTKWTKFSMTGIIHETTYKVFEFYKILQSWNKGETLYIKDLKIEFGNKPTDWSPALEDLDNKIDCIETAFLKSQIPERNLISADAWNTIIFHSWYGTGQKRITVVRDSFWTTFNINSNMISSGSFSIFSAQALTTESGVHSWTALIKTDIPYDKLLNNVSFDFVQPNNGHSGVSGDWKIVDSVKKIYRVTFISKERPYSEGSTWYINIVFANTEQYSSATYFSVSYPWLEYTDTPSLYFPTGYYTTQKSNAKLITQIAHPNNYLIYDDLDKPSAMVAIPKFYLDEVIDGAEHIVHPAFLVNGVEQNAIYISKYQNIVENDRAYSLPIKDPAVGINFDQAWNCCKNKGAGWHIMTNAEWAAIALWCKKNGTIPKGNNNYGKDISETALPQKAIAASIGSDGKINRVLTGSGRESWYHDGTYAGIADLNGNTWEWLGDMRLIYGELQVIPYNNAASGEYDVSANSEDWKAINANATSYDDLFITPDGSGTTANSVKLDWISNHWQWQGAPIVTSSIDLHNATFASTTYSGLSDFCRYYIQAMALLPKDEATADDYGSDCFYAINGEAERCVFRGGSWYYNTEAGVFSVSLRNSRSHYDSYIGARSAYINASAQPLAATLELSDSLQAE